MSTFYCMWGRIMKKRKYILIALIIFMIGVIATGLYIGNKSLKLNTNSTENMVQQEKQKKDSKKKEKSLVEDNQDSDWDNKSKADLEKENRNKSRSDTVKEVEKTEVQAEKNPEGDTPFIKGMDEDESSKNNDKKNSSSDKTSNESNNKRKEESFNTPFVPADDE